MNLRASIGATAVLGLASAGFMSSADKADASISCETGVTTQSGVVGDRGWAYCENTSGMAAEAFYAVVHCTNGVNTYVREGSREYGTDDGNYSSVTCPDRHHASSVRVVVIPT